MIYYNILFSKKKTLKQRNKNYHDRSQNIRKTIIVILKINIDFTLKQICLFSIFPYLVFRYLAWKIQKQQKEQQQEQQHSWIREL